MDNMSIKERIEASVETQAARADVKISYAAQQNAIAAHVRNKKNLRECILNASGLSDKLVEYETCVTRKFRTVKEVRTAKIHEAIHENCFVGRVIKKDGSEGLMTVRLSADAILRVLD